MHRQYLKSVYTLIKNKNICTNSFDRNTFKIMFLLVCQGIDYLKKKKKRKRERERDLMANPLQYNDQSIPPTP